MKKIALLISIFSLFNSFSFAQQKFQLGLSLSPNINWLKANSENLESKGQNLGFNYGITGDFNFAENYAFATGVNIIKTGGELQYADVLSSSDGSTKVGGRTKADIDLRYIEIPLTLKLRTNEIGYITYYGQFGIGLGVNYDAKADLEFTSSTNNTSTSRKDVNYQDEINLMRASLIVGIGAEYNLSGNTSILMGLAFNNGFSNVLSEDNYETDANGNGITSSNRNKDFKAISNYLVLNLGILF